MSLIAWYPLNGKLNNQGLSNIAITNNGATVNNNGKIGKCYSFNGSNNYMQAPIVLTNSMTFCLWIKFNGTGEYHIIDARDTAASEAGFQPMYGGVNYGLQIYTSNGGSNNYTKEECGFTTNTWYHLTAIIAPTYSELFINGVSKGKKSDGSGGSTSRTVNMRIGTRCTGANWLNGCINDIRIYNNILSVKEIKEISKALILHYNFNDISIQNTIYDSSGYRYNATLIGPEYYKMRPIIKNLLGSPNNFSLSNITNNSGDLTYTPNVLAMANYDLPTPIVGHKYYGRVEQLVPPNTSFADGRFEYFVTDASGTGNVVFTAFSEAVQDNQWHMYSSIQQFTGLYAQSGYYMRSFSVNATNTSKRRNHMIIDLTDAFGPGNEPTKEWCDKNIPYFTGTLSSFRHPNAGRGSAVLHSIGHPSAKIQTTLNPSFITNGTLVVWYKKDSGAMNYNSGNFLMATQNSSGQYLCATNGDSPPFNGSCSYSHWYVDGIEQNKSNFMDTNWHMYSPTGINLSSWTSLSFHAHGDDSWLYRGDIAEIRLYATQLSSQDIKNLYERVISITKEGKLMTQGEYLEE